MDIVSERFETLISTDMKILSWERSTILDPDSYSEQHMYSSSVHERVLSDIKNFQSSNEMVQVNSEQMTDTEVT